MQVVNAAIAGHSTFGHIWSFNMWFPLIPNCHARYVLAFIGINDVAAINPNRYDLMKSGDWQRRLRYYFVNNSALYNLYRTIRGNIRARNAHLIHGGGEVFDIKWIKARPQPNLETARHKIRERLEAYGERIKIFSKKIRGFGAQPIFITQPRNDYRIRNGKVFGKKKGDGTANVNSYINITLYNKELMKACAEVEAICIDLADGFSFANGDAYDHIHTTPKGSRKIGEAIYELLKPHITAPGTGSHINPFLAHPPQGYYQNDARASGSRRRIRPGGWMRSMRRSNDPTGEIDREARDAS
jgi:lysophospholipase L1-like esterase